VSRLPRSADARSSAPDLPAANCRPAPRCVVAAAHPAKPPSLGGVARTKRALGHLAESVGWSARPSLELMPSFSPPAGRSDPLPVAVAPALAAQSARL